MNELNIENIVSLSVADSMPNPLKTLYLTKTKIEDRKSNRRMEI